MGKSKIAWTEKSWAIVTGCTKASSGCDNCYAADMARRLQGMGVKKYANGFTPTCHPDCLDEPLTWKKPTLVFVPSMGDLFHPQIPDDFIEKVMETIEILLSIHIRSLPSVRVEWLCSSQLMLFLTMLGLELLWKMLRYFIV